MHPRVLVFDTETVPDECQNLKIGSFQIFHNGYFQFEGLFYDPTNLNEKEIKTVEAYARIYKKDLYLLDEFVDKVFYPEVFRLKTLCIGFNLAFDLSRLAKRSGDSKGKNRGGFTLTLSDDPFNPPIIIKKLGDAYSFRFTSTKQNQGNNRFSGYFLDIQKLAEVLLQKKHISLEQAAKMLNTPTQKMKGVKHGKVTEKYIDYNIIDVDTTYEVYEALIKELKVYQIRIPPTEIYSSASIGKHALEQLGVKPFLEMNPDFSDQVIGHIMESVGKV